MEGELNDSQRELLDHIVDCDGAEIHSESWDDAEVLVKLGWITLSGARGPGKQWKRAERVT